MKEEALKLADDLEELHEQDLIDGVAHLSMPQASAMIRRLVGELNKYKMAWNMAENELEKQEYKRTHEGFSTIIDKATFPRWSKEQDLFNSWKDINSAPQTKPLSDEEIGDCVDDCFGLMALQHKYTYSIDQVQEYGLKLCKAIEERHGIK